MDFTGSTARLHVRSKYSSTDTLIELTTENGGIELTEDGNHAEHVGCRHGSMAFSGSVYDLEIAPPAGDPYKIIKGNVFLKREVTHS